MLETLRKNWWLLALCGGLDAAYSLANFFMQDADGSLTLRKYVLKGTLLLMGRLALAAGVCTIAAGVWRSREGKPWLLVVNGIALGALGLILNGAFGFRIGFRTVALLLVVMAISSGVFELSVMRGLKRVADEWFFGTAGAGSVAFGLVFLAYAFRWIKLVPGTHTDLFWFGSYFGFSAVSMVGLALRLRGWCGSFHERVVRAS